MKYRSICIAGVDGTGKSSTIDMLVEKLGEDKVIVQYMGARLWETTIAQKYIEEVEIKGILKPFLVFMNVYAYIYEMYYRVNKHKRTDKLVIFDRYASEQALFRSYYAKSIAERIIAKIFRISFLRFFPEPDLSFYLVCPIEVSISRKSDIVTQKEKTSLIENKKILDSYYNSPKGNIIVIDTNSMNQEMIVSKIIENLNSRKLL